MTTATFQDPNVVQPLGTLKAWHGPNATAFRECVAAEFDALALTAELVGDARSPLKCDASLLPRHAADRKIRRYTFESEASWRMRLAKWKQCWRFAGKAYGILRQLRILLSPFGRPLLRYVHTTGDGGMTEWFTLAPGDGTVDYFVLDGIDPEYSRHLEKPGNWLWDPQASTGQWSRYWILIYTSGLVGVPASFEWDDAGEWDGGSDYWDGGLSSDIISDVRAMCTDWQAANSALFGVFQVHDDTAFDPTGSGALYPSGNWHLVIDPVTGAQVRRDGVTYSYVRLAV